MKMQLKKWLAVGMTTLILASGLAACTDNSAQVSSSTSTLNKTDTPTTTADATETPQTSTPTPEPLKPVELIWYVVGDPHADQAMVDEKMNEMLKKDVNATIKLNFTTWNDWTSKYNLLLVSGETVDAIFASTWADFTKYAKKGAFMDITEMIPEYAPQTWGKVPKEDWMSASFDGKIFGVPCTKLEFTPSGWFYREDLRKKYNTPEIKDIASIEAYLDAIKQNEKSMTPIVQGINEIPNLFGWSSGYEALAGDEKSLIQLKSYDTPRELVTYPFTEEYVEFVTLMKSWADKGYWSKDILADKTNPSDALKAGTGAVAWMNPGSAYGMFQNFQQEHPDWEGGYFPFSRFKGYTVANSPMNNGIAIPVSAKNPERSLMVLDLLRHNQEYNRLTTYGIEGYHWDLADDGVHSVVPGKTQDPLVNFGFWTTSWGWGNGEFVLERVDVFPGKAAFEEEFSSMQRPNIYSDVKFDYEPVKNEKAAIEQVNTEFSNMLFLGLAPDLNKAIEEYRNQLTNAGIEKYRAELESQLFKYYEEKGIQ